MSDQRHDDQGPSRPQVIDLEAEEIKTEPDSGQPKPDDSMTDEAEVIRGAEPPPPPPPPPPTPPPAQQRRRSRGSAAWIVAALILGAIGGGWLYRDVISSYLPSNEMLAMRERLSAVEANGAGLAQQIAGLQQAADAAAQAAATAGDGAGAAAQKADEALNGLSQAGGRIDALDQRISAAETSLQSASADLAQFRTSLSSGATQGGAAPVDNAALAALAQRIDVLEKDVASLKSSAGGGGEKAAVTSTLSQALSDLKAKVAAGAAYPDEYDRIARMVPAAAGLEAVGAHAAEGLPNVQGLTAELRAAIPALPQPAAPVAEDDSYFGTLMKSLSGVITIRPIGETDWPSVAAKAAAFAEAGDLNQAIATIDAAEGEKPMSLTQWRDRAAGRLQLEAALAQVSEAVLRQIAAMGGAQQ